MRSPAKSEVPTGGVVKAVTEIDHHHGPEVDDVHPHLLHQRHQDWGQHDDRGCQVDPDSPRKILMTISKINIVVGDGEDSAGQRL